MKHMAIDCMQALTGLVQTRQLDLDIMLMLEVMLLSLMVIRTAFDLQWYSAMSAKCQA